MCVEVKEGLAGFRQDCNQGITQGYRLIGAFQLAQVVRNLPANAEDARDVSSVPVLGRFPGEGNGNPLQYSCLENSTDRGTW